MGIASKELLKKPDFHDKFVRDGGLRSLMMMTQQEMKNTELLYLAVFSLWLLSYNDEMMAEFKNQHVVYSLVQVVRVVTREKVVRVCFATLKNILYKEDFNK